MTDWLVSFFLYVFYKDGISLPHQSQRVLSDPAPFPPQKFVILAWHTTLRSLLGDSK